jgi:hypothetical protein
MECGADLNKTGKSPRTGKTDSQKRSQAQEKRAAKRTGARVQPASGAMSDAKGDLRKRGELRIECKLTRAKSFTLKREDLEKLESETAGGELPVFEIEFQDRLPYKRYAILPGWLYDYYREGDQE